MQKPDLSTHRRPLPLMAMGAAEQARASQLADALAVSAPGAQSASAHRSSGRPIIHLPESR
jgi:hypothetical protein